MTPHLHPRSTATSTLFAGTLLASFIVVAIPHLVPCPRPHGRNHLNTEIQFDENGKRIRRSAAGAPGHASDGGDVRNPPISVQHSKNNDLHDEVMIFQKLQKEAEVLKADKDKERECPVPKPKGRLGKWLGFEEEKD